MVQQNEDGERVYASPAGVVGWVLFDCSTQPFYTLVTTFIFGPYFVAHLAASPAEGQSLWGLATGAAGLVIACLAPILGAIADQAGARKRWCVAFGGVMALAAGSLWFAAPGADHAVLLALAGFALASIAAEFATVFNNALMPALVPPERLGRLSGTGWAIGYIGGLVSLALTLLLFAADPESGKTIAGIAPLFGLDPATHEGDRVVGPYSALWFVLFILPFVLFTPDRQRHRPLGPAVRQGFASLKHTLKVLPEHGHMARFLIANMIYTDGLLALFTFGGVYAAGIFGWSTTELGLFGIVILVAATLGALAGGPLDDRLGAKRVVLGSLALITVAALGILASTPDTLLGLVAVTPPEPGDGVYGSASEKLYVALSCLLGVASGPSQAASRSLLCRMAPPDMLGQFFGLFALTGKITSFLGPLTVAATTALTQSQRLGILPLIVFFVVGALLLAGVDDRRRERF